MGGNAIKNATRLEKQFYEYVADGTSSTLKTAFPGARVSVIPAYRSKESFGDLDIVISNVSVPELKEFCKKALNSEEVIVNGNVISFGLEVTSLVKRTATFQIDLICIPAEGHDFALNYFSYNDLGNFIGQTARGIGLKFGHDGLWYKYIVDTKFIAQILISDDFQEAIEFLGYDYKRFQKGFETLEDVFEYATTSEYFSKWNYQLENRNAVGRVRDIKRKSYMSFVEWLKDKDLPNLVPRVDLGMALAVISFHSVAIDYTTSTLSFHRANRFKKKFNGELVSTWTGLTGKELGAAMGEFKKLYEGSMSVLDVMSPEKLEETFKTWFAERGDSQ